MKRYIRKFIPKQRIKVSIFIVGGQKSGTSALHNYLTKHESISGGVKKEHNFFSHPEKFSRGYDWYHQQFTAPLIYKNKLYYLDSTPRYLSIQNVAKKIYDYNSNAKIIILLREPVSRAHSAWNMYMQFSELDVEEKESLVNKHIEENQKEEFSNFINQNPFPSFDDYVIQELSDGSLNNKFTNIIQRGVYVDQIKPYIDLFGLNNVLIFDSDYFKKNKLEVTNKILKSVGLNNLILEDSHLKPIHSRKYDSFISDTTQKRLNNFYEPHNERLFNLINQKFEW